MLERELALYQRLQQRGVRVTFLTYGRGKGQPHDELLAGIDVIALGNHTSPRRGFVRLMLKHWPTLIQGDILKTNQIPGSQLAIWVQRLLRKKLIVRCGYLPSVFISQQDHTSAELEETLEIEGRAFHAADAAIVASESDRFYVVEKHGVAADRVHVIPNYVVTDVFRPMPDVPKEYDVACVAKSTPQKNIKGLLTALALLKARGHDVSLILLGSCSVDPAVEAFIAAKRLNVTLAGNVPNFELPRYLASARLFMLPSFYEGTPKALLEAMSCGVPCIGTEVIGIRELMSHGETGWLCGTDQTSIADAILHVLSDRELQTSLGYNGREFVVRNFSLDRVVDLELELYASLTSR